MKRPLTLLLASLLLSAIPLSSIVAQPEDQVSTHPEDCLVWHRDGTCIWTKRDEEILKQIEERDKRYPRVFIPEPNVYVSGKGYVTDEQGMFLKTTHETDYYYDSYGNSMYVRVNDKLKFGRVYASAFKGTYFSVLDSNNRCLNCDRDIQTFQQWKSKEYIKSYVDGNSIYNGYMKIHN